MHLQVFHTLGLTGGCLDPHAAFLLERGARAAMLQSSLVSQAPPGRAVVFGGAEAGCCCSPGSSTFLLGFQYFPVRVCPSVLARGARSSAAGMTKIMLPSALTETPSSDGLRLMPP
jgi:hypothetical protein